MKIYLLNTSKIRYEEINSKLFNSWPEQYEIIKAMEWADLLNRLIIPKRWNPPTRWGTTCIVKEASSQSEYDKAVQQLADHVCNINNEYEALDIDMRVEIKR